MDLHVFSISDHIADNINTHTHKFFQMIYCKSGKGIIRLSGKEHVTEPGSIYLAAPGVSHGIENIEGLDIIEFKFYAYGNLLERLKKLSGVFSISEDSLMTSLLLGLVEEGFAKGMLRNSAIDAGMMFFLINACENFSASRPTLTSCGLRYVNLDAVEEKTHDMDIVIFKLRDYIEKHFNEDITLESLAREFHFNKTYFVKHFKVFFEISPMRYVNNVRLEKARELLATTEFSVLEISEKTGFNSLHYFSNKFSERYGISPSNYRLQQKRTEL